MDNLKIVTLFSLLYELKMDNLKIVTSFPLGLDEF